MEQSKTKTLYNAMVADGDYSGSYSDFYKEFLAPGDKGYQFRLDTWKKFHDAGADVGANYEEFKVRIGLEGKSSQRTANRGQRSEVRGQRTESKAKAAPYMGLVSKEYAQDNKVTPVVPKTYTTIEDTTLPSEVSYYPNGKTQDEIQGGKLDADAKARMGYEIAKNKARAGQFADATQKTTDAIIDYATKANEQLSKVRDISQAKGVVKTDDGRYMNSAGEVHDTALEASFGEKERQSGVRLESITDIENRIKELEKNREALREGRSMSMLESETEMYDKRLAANESEIQRLKEERSKSIDGYIENSGIKDVTTIELLKRGKEGDTFFATTLVDAKIADAEKRKASIHAELEKERKKRQQSADSKSGIVRFAQGLAAAETNAIDPNIGLSEPSEEEKALNVAYRNVDKEIETLKRERENPGFWKTVGQGLMKPELYLFGMPELAEAANTYSIAQKVEKGEKLSEAENKALESIYKTTETSSLYSGNDTFFQKAGDMTVEALPFVAEIAATGGVGGVIEGAAKGAAKSVGKKILSEATQKAAEKGAKSALLKQAMIKNTGVAIGELGSAAFTANTMGAGRTWSAILGRKVGTLTKDADGNYKFVDGESWGSAIYKGQAASIIEYYTEKL